MGYGKGPRSSADLSSFRSEKHLLSSIGCVSLGPHQLLRQGGRSVDLAQGFLNPPRIHRNSTSLHLAVGKIPGEGFNITVEDDSHHFALPAHRWRSRIASNDVSG